MLRLPGDVPPSGTLLADHLCSGDPDLVAIVLALAAAAPAIAERLAAGALPGDPARIVGTNESGDRQKALDLAAHEHVLDALRHAPVRMVLSEEAEEPIRLDENALLDVAIDPIDGSGSIGTGLPLGLLFAIWPAAPEGFTRAGRSAVAAGYVSFGHSTDMGVSLGDGVTLATLDRARNAFRVVRERVVVPRSGGLLAFNAANVRHWPDGLRLWASEVGDGADGPRGADANMRWLAAAVGELHRILLKGGTFLYPADVRPGYERGRLRLLYEAVPIAFLIEQAGGAATDGLHPILDLLPDHPHVHTPLVFGAADEVALIARHLS